MKNLIISLLLSLIFLNGAFGYDYQNSAETEFKKGNYLKANELLKINLRKYPENIKSRYLYAQSFIGLGEIENAQKEYEKVIEQSPNGYLAKLSLIAVSKIYEFQAGEELNKNSTKNRRPSLGINYIENALFNGKIVRWNLAEMPLKIFINRAEDVPGYQSYYYQTVSKAVVLWMKEAEPGTLSAVLVNNSGEANILVDFAAEIGKKTGKGYLAGLATPHIKGSVLEKCIVKLRTADINNKPFSESEIFITALHELGHAFGIWGHSSKTRDVMYDCESANSGNSAKTLSLRDINTLRLLYMLDPDISNFSPGEQPGINSVKNKVVLGNSDKRTVNKFRESIDYVKKHPKNAVSWTNLGNVYESAENYNDAIICYKKALDTDSSFSEARGGLAVAYDKAGDRKNALTQFTVLVEQNPENIGFSYNLALFLKKNNQNAKAYKVIKNLIKVNPEAANDKNIKDLSKTF